MQLKQLPELNKKRVLSWQLDFDALAKDETFLSSLLSPKETLRANRFHFDHDRRAFTYTRAALRLLIGEYMKLLPTKVKFTYNKHGKPLLSDKVHSNPIKFNVSHSNKIGYIAFSHSTEIGVDVEFSPKNTFESNIELAKRFFTKNEYNALLELPHSMRNHVFYRIWTRKEAYIKAIGTGLATPLNSFEVGAGSIKPSLSLADNSNVKWQLFDISPSEDYTAALATSLEVKEVQTLRFESHI